MKEYEIELTEEQMELLELATRVNSAMLLGDFSEIAELVGQKEQPEVLTALGDLKGIAFPTLSPEEKIDVVSEDASTAAKVLTDINSSLRASLGKDVVNSTGYSDQPSITVTAL